MRKRVVVYDAIRMHGKRKKSEMEKWANWKHGDDGFGR